MRLLFLLLCLLFCIEGKGQVKEMVILEEGDMGSLWYGSQRMDKFKELDRTLLTVTYRMNFIQDTVKRKILVDQMILQIGKNYSKFYSQRTFWTICLIRTLRWVKLSGRKDMALMGRCISTGI